MDDLIALAERCERNATLLAVRALDHPVTTDRDALTWAAEYYTVATGLRAAALKLEG